MSMGLFMRMTLTASLSVEFPLWEDYEVPQCVGYCY